MRSQAAAFGFVYVLAGRAPVVSLVLAARRRIWRACAGFLSPCERFESVSRGGLAKPGGGRESRRFLRLDHVEGVRRDEEGSYEVGHEGVECTISSFFVCFLLDAALFRPIAVVPGFFHGRERPFALASSFPLWTIHDSVPNYSANVAREWGPSLTIAFVIPLTVSFVTSLSFSIFP